MQGGLRNRMILESFQRWVVEDLENKGWFDPGRAHAALKVVQGFPDEREEVVANTLAFSYGDGSGMSVEMGSRAEEFSLEMFVDLFSDSESFSIDLMGDVYALLRSAPRMDVYDWRNENESDFEPSFSLEIDYDSIDDRRPPRPANPWQRHWRVVSAIFWDDRPNG